MKDKTELTPEKEAEDWLVKVRGYKQVSQFFLNEIAKTILSDHATFVREVVEVMEGFGYAYSIFDDFIDSEYGVWFIWGEPESGDPNESESDVYYEKIVNHNWPLAAIKAAKQTPEIRKIMEKYDAKS